MVTIDRWLFYTGGQILLCVVCIHVSQLIKVEKEGEHAVYLQESSMYKWSRTALEVVAGNCHAKPSPPCLSFFDVHL